MSTDQKIQAIKLECFKDHQITSVEGTGDITRFRFSGPNRGCYWFDLTCADNLIVMTGDCYSLMIEPGYGRNGLAFLRGSIKSIGYFLGKCPFGKLLKEYSRDAALKAILHYKETDCLTEDQYEDFLDRLTDEGEFYDEVKYYELCHDFDIDDPSSPTVLTRQTLTQLAGLQRFVEVYEKQLAEAKESINVNT